MYFFSGKYVSENLYGHCSFLLQNINEEADCKEFEDVLSRIHTKCQEYECYCPVNLTEEATFIKLKNPNNIELKLKDSYAISFNVGQFKKAEKTYISLYLEKAEPIEIKQSKVEIIDI